MLELQTSQQTALSSTHSYQYLRKVGSYVTVKVFGGLGVVAVEEVASVTIGALSFFEEAEARFSLI